MRRDSKVTQIGLDCHRKFSNATARGPDGKVAWRERLDHRDRHTLRAALGAWPEGTPVILEGTFGWGWLSDELRAAGLDAHLANSKKVASWRDARGLAKSNRVDADLLSELWDQQPRWWEVGWPRPRSESNGNGFVIACLWSRRRRRSRTASTRSCTGTGW